jgi:hypothetical protein
MLIDPSQIRVLGPLSAFAAGFADELTHQGYTPHSARFQMRLMGHLSRWLVGEELGAGDLRTVEVERFLRARRAAGYTHLLSIKAMRPMLTYLSRSRSGATTTSTTHIQQSCGRGAGAVPELSDG